MDKHMRFEGAALITLSLMLVTVFMLSVWMYDDLAGETEDGTLAVFAANVREFIDENEAVSAFLGLDEGVAEADVETDAETDAAAVAAEAAAYIARYNAIYDHLQ